MIKFIRYFYLFGLIIGGIIFLIEWHTGKVSQFIKIFRGAPAANSRAADNDLPSKAEEGPEDLVQRWEKLSRENDWKTIVDETEDRKDPIAKAYRTIAILESGKYPHLLLEAIQNMRQLIDVQELPASLKRRLVLSLGDPEAPGPTPEENLEAYKEIINSLGIATHPSSLKKLRELEALAAEEGEKH